MQTGGIDHGTFFGFRVQGSGFRGFGFRVQGFRV